MTLGRVRVGGARLLLGVASALGALALAGCDVFDASLLDASPETDAAMDAEMDGATSCVPRHPPARPEVDDGGDVGETVFAIRDVQLDQGRDWRGIGFDVDGLCSYAPEPEVECVPPTGSIETDGMDGIDNSLGHNILSLVDIAFDGNLQEDQRDVMNLGRGVVIIRLRGWNGTANDPAINATLAQSTAGAAAEEDGSAPEGEVVDSIPVGPDGEPLPSPEWDGTDWFWVREDAFTGGNLDLPRVEDANAYMADGTLVMRFPEQTNIIFSGVELGIIIRPTDMDITVDLSDDLMTVERMVVGGRWAIEDILITAEKAGICPSQPEYGVVENNLADAADVMSDPAAGGPDATCDAISLGMSFGSGVRANILGVSDVKDLVSVCEQMDGGVDGGIDAGAPDGGSTDGGGVDSGGMDGGSTDGAVDAPSSG